MKIKTLSVPIPRFLSSKEAKHNYWRIFNALLVAIAAWFVLMYARDPERFMKAFFDLF